MIKIVMNFFIAIQLLVPFLMCCFDYTIEDKIKIVEKFKQLIKESEITRKECDMKPEIRMNKVTTTMAENDSKNRAKDNRAVSEKSKDTSNADRNFEKMFLNTHVLLKPCNLNKHEAKTILTVDIGGSFLKINTFRVENGSLTPGKDEKYPLSGEPDFTNQSIFEFTAKRIENYIIKNLDDYAFDSDGPSVSDKNGSNSSSNIDNNERKTANIPIALTFSHPMIHNSISSAKIISFNKNFQFRHEKEIDPGLRLNEELSKLKITTKKYNLKLEVKVLLNDTTATTATGYQKECNFSQNNNLIIGIVLGTGTNGAYTDFTNNVIINTEWASLDKNIFKLTKYDVEVMNEVLGKAKNVNFLSNIRDGINKNAIYNKLVKPVKDKLSNIIPQNIKANIKDKMGIDLPHNYNCLDCLCGGYKFVDLVNKAILGELNITEKLDLNEIIRIQDSRDRNEKEDEINKIILSLKRRTSAIVSSLVWGITISQYENLRKNAENKCFGNKFGVTIYLNGTLFHNGMYLQILKDEVKELSDYYRDLPFEKFNFVVSESASLEGAAYVLLNELE